VNKFVENRKPIFLCQERKKIDDLFAETFSINRRRQDLDSLIGLDEWIDQKLVNGVVIVERQIKRAKIREHFVFIIIFDREFESRLGVAVGKFRDFHQRTT
jgi:hypothetical protein